MNINQLQKDLIKEKYVSQISSNHLEVARSALQYAYNLLDVGNIGGAMSALNKALTSTDSTQDIKDLLDVYLGRKTDERFKKLERVL